MQRVAAERLPQSPDCTRRPILPSIPAGRPRAGVFVRWLPFGIRGTGNRAAIHVAASAGVARLRTSLTKSMGPSGPTPQLWPKHFTVFVLFRMPTEAVLSPLLCRSGCQQWRCPFAPRRRSSLCATSRIGRSRLIQRISGRPLSPPDRRKRGRGPNSPIKCRRSMACYQAMPKDRTVGIVRLPELHKAGSLPHQPPTTDGCQ